MPYDPAKGNLYDMDSRTFDNVIVDEIFYKTDNVRDAQSYRKLDEVTAFNIKERVKETFASSQTVYVKN